MSASPDASSSSSPVPRQRARHRATGGLADLVPSRPPVIHPPRVAPRVTATTCSCGTAWSSGADRCGFCGLVRPVRLLGIRRLTGRHWLAGPLRRVERVPADRQDLAAENAWLAAISGALPVDEGAAS